MAAVSQPRPLKDLTHSTERLRLVRLSSAVLRHHHHDDKSTLACRHWLEVDDPQHRYGTYLRPYYDHWRDLCIAQPFFTWLDQGDGRSLSLSPASFNGCAKPRHVVSRHTLDDARVHYCNDEERLKYLVRINADSQLVWHCSGEPVDTTLDEYRWIFVIDRAGRMFINRKLKGGFHHSSFVAGASVRAAGRISIRDGRVLSIGPNSGHYRTSLPQLVCSIYEYFGECVLPVTTTLDNGENSDIGDFFLS